MAPGVALKVLKIDYVRVDRLKPNPWNANRMGAHEFELLTRSIMEDGWTQPIIVLRITQPILDDLRIVRPSAQFSVDDLVIVDGEHRWRVAVKLGVPEAPVVFVPWKLAQSEIATLRHNRARGMEDEEMADDILRDLATLGEGEWAEDALLLGDGDDPVFEPFSEPEGEPSDLPPAYRLMLIWTGDDAELVRGVLEPDPAAKILELCA